MNNTGIKRILIALDASVANRSALQVATLLASQLQAELQAVFVEDINLLRLAELPFAREMVFGSREGRPINLVNMERQMAAQAMRLRQLVETTAEANRVQVEFKILRGRISNELCQAAQQMDLLILGMRTQLLQHDLKLGQVAQDVLAATHSNVLLLQSGASLDRPVAVLFDGSDASQRALQLAIQLAQGDHDQLKVIYPAQSPDKQLVLQQQLKALTQSAGIEAGEILLLNNTTEALLAAILKYRSRVLVVEADNDLFNSETIKALIRQSHIPVIVMR